MMVLITGRACTAYDLALRLMGGRLPDFAGRSGHPSIAGLPMIPDRRMQGYSALPALPMRRSYRDSSVGPLSKGDRTALEIGKTAAHEA